MKTINVISNICQGIVLLPFFIFLGFIIFFPVIIIFMGICYVILGEIKIGMFLIVVGFIATLACYGEEISEMLEV